jgi:hypothetical protein
MPNGLRHVLGLIAGVILAPVIAAGLLYGTDRLARLFQTYFFRGNDQWTAVAILTLAGVTLGVLVGSRISPLASLIPGLLFTGVGGLWAVAPVWMTRHSSHKLPDAFDRGYQYVGPYGVLLVLGLLLLVGSLSPSRWRAREPRTVRQAYEYGPPDGGFVPASGPVPGLGQGSAAGPGTAPRHPAREGQEPPDWASPPPGPSPFRSP